MNNKGLEIKDLTFKYGNKTILDNISFKVENNDFIAIVGKSGAGKSTLLRCLNMLNIPQKGEIIFYQVVRNNLKKFVETYHLYFKIIMYWIICIP